MGGTPDVDVYGIAWPQHIALWCCQIHRTLEGQILVVENVVTEYLAFSRFVFVRIIPERVGHHEVDGFVHLYIFSISIIVRMFLVLPFAVFDAELRGILLVFPDLILALLTIGFAHSALRGLRTCRDVLGTKGTVLYLLLILLLNTAQLVDGDATLH